ncbi:MAG: PH domain-containing protein [Muribaculaceae bacterium]
MNRIKRKCNLSAWSLAISAIFIIIMATAFYTCEIQVIRLIIGLIFIGAVIPALYFCPLSVEVDDEAVTVNFPLRHRSFKLSDIASADDVQPTMGEWRICGSGGFFGYWGWFSNKVLGRYFAYYGRGSECFIIRLRSGRIYMLGCADHLTVLQCIQSRISA